MNFFPQVVNYINQIFKNASWDGEIRHFDRTVYWMKVLKPEADEAMLIAAYAHDSERAYRAKDYDKIDKTKDGFNDKEHIKHHQETGARIASDFLVNIGAPSDMVEKVKKLISHHEEGGDEEANILKDADTISFFENNIPYFLAEKVAKVGKEKVKQKFNRMFERITLTKAKEIALPMYQDAINRLEK